MATSEKEQQRIEGILQYLDDYLDHRFSQARRVNPAIGSVETDMRLHQTATMQEVLAGKKGFGPQRIMVANILCSADEVKKAALFNPVDQVCILQEIVPEEQDATGSSAGQIAVRDVKSFYEALDPSLGRILNLAQTWIWWDLNDAAELYRFDLQEKRLLALRSAEIDEKTQEAYRQEMEAGGEITREKILEFEFTRSREIVRRFEKRLAESEGYQIIPILTERQGSEEADMLTVSLAKRLMAMQRINAAEEIEPNVRTHYAKALGIPEDQVTKPAILNHENVLAARERSRLAEELHRCLSGSQVENYKETQLHSLQVRLESIAAKIGIKARPKPQESAPEQ